jgi:Toastrack DUF4097
MHTLRSLPIALTLALTVPLPLLRPASLGAQRADRDHPRGCRNDEDRGDDNFVRYCEERHIALRPGGSLSFSSSPNGGVRVEGWARDSVDVVAAIHTRAHTESEAKALAGRVKVNSDAHAVWSEGPANRRGESWWVSVEASVPAKSDLEAVTENGPVSLFGVQGHIELTSENGPVTLSDAGGDVRARTTNGPLVIGLTGSQWAGRGLDAETTNGPARLTVPDGYSAELEAGTTNGPMSLGFPVMVQGRNIGKRISTTLGNGGARIRVMTTNGPLVLTRTGAPER